MSKRPTELNGLGVALSGAVPDAEDLRSHGWSELDIRLAVVTLAERVLDAGARLVHGNHPTYLPLVEGVARSFPSPPRVTIITSQEYFTPTQIETFRHRHEPYADVIVTPSGRNKDHSLSILRKELVKRSDALVCIGGRLHSDTGKAGVDEEVHLALQEQRAAYLLGSFGGFTQYLYKTRFARVPTELNNCLDEAENLRLAMASDPADAIALVIAGLQRLWSKQIILP